jgi:hypothetical protein
MKFTLKNINWNFHFRTKKFDSGTFEPRARNPWARSTFPGKWLHSIWRETASCCSPAFEMIPCDLSTWGKITSFSGYLIYVRDNLKRRSLTDVTWINNSKKFSNRLFRPSNTWTKFFRGVCQLTRVFRCCNLNSKSESWYSFFYLLYSFS